ncbi:unnamed protein product [Symbiodinium necroappetens]|uniref:Uncharacterized protein n=1 Tax=Symbiodinium necroappetens TaxID=1628268 RepID=A0A812VQD4_9DINO|nr:unnamed protein product [Symbiodinium necroappetens]
MQRRENPSENGKRSRLRFFSEVEEATSPFLDRKPCRVQTSEVIVEHWILTLVRLSDDEDDDAGRVGGGSAKREESIGELLGDSKELKFGAPARQRRQQGFRLGGGVDPLQALVDQTRPPITEDDEPDSEFEREFERAVAGAASSMPARPAPPEPSAEPAGDDLDDIVGEIGDILGDEQLTSARRTLRRSQTAPTAALDHHTAELEETEKNQTEGLADIGTVDRDGLGWPWVNRP